MALTAAVSEEQKLYARWLSVGARAGLAVLSACFLVYVLELLEPQVPLRELPALWAHPVEHFRTLTGAPAGWGWIALLGKGDYLSFVGIVMLGLVTLVCYARIVPALLKRGERLQAALAAAQVLVLLAAASGLLASPARADEVDLKRAQQIVSGRCFLCHGAQGESASELYPRLAGQNPVYMAKQLANFATGERKSTAMQPMAAGLTPQERSALGLYFSRQKSEPHPAADAQLAAQGARLYADRCTACHGGRGHGSETLPRLAGQVASYLAAQLRSFGARSRTNDNAVMQGIAAQMTEQDIRAVAEYLSGLD